MNRLLPFLLAFLAGLPALAADGTTADALVAIQQSATAWTRLRAEAGRLQGEWEREREMLASTRLALEERIAALTQQRETAEVEAAAARTEIEALRARHAVLVQSVDAMETRVAALVSSLNQLRPLLPPRLGAALELPYRSLADEKLSTSEKVQHAVAILSRCLQFNTTITYSEEVLGGARGPDARVVEVVYWGLAGAYAIDRAARKAFVGRPGPEGWRWSPQDEAFAAIRDLVDVQKDATEPRFVEVPARLVDLPAQEERP